jgi:L-threonylcarbamoyladenylate synthase
MSEVYRVDPEHPLRAAKAIRRAADAIRRGEAVVIPTETVYGLAARPDLPEATGRLFEAKRRPLDLNLPILAPSTAEAWEIARSMPAAARLAEALWPGPLTLILPRADRSMAWHLGQEKLTVGVRVPDHRLSAVLMELVGPIAATSANVSGEPPLQDAEALAAQFGESVAVYLVATPGGPGPAGSASTVVDLTGSIPRLLRRGPVSSEVIFRVAAGGVD